MEEDDLKPTTVTNDDIQKKKKKNTLYQRLSSTGVCVSSYSVFLFLHLHIYVQMKHSSVVWRTLIIKSCKKKQMLQRKRNCLFLTSIFSKFHKSCQNQSFEIPMKSPNVLNAKMHSQIFKKVSVRKTLIY